MQPFRNGVRLGGIWMSPKYRNYMIRTQTRVAELLNIERVFEGGRLVTQFKET